MSEGYILFSPLLSTKTYLIDRKGLVVHTWESKFAPGASVYLLTNGHLLRCGRQPDVPVFHGGGLGGRIQEFDWDGKHVWDFTLASGNMLQHHDIEPLPNGNVLLIAWERKTYEQTIQAGRKQNLVGPAGLWPVCILEIQPHPPKGGHIVWEWHLWDHLIQDIDPELKNYGNVSEHPELIDINGEQEPEHTDEELERLKSLGYVDDSTKVTDLRADLAHTNAIAYNPRLDQIAISVSNFNEIWIIDHSTTTREATGRTGGRIGKGGDIVYRWGNPSVYDRGTVEQQQLFCQHDVRWIPEGYQDGGHIMIFNNGAGRPNGRYSSVIVIQPPVDTDGHYSIKSGKRFGPDKPLWEYTARDKQSFYADFISSAHRLVNGNTFICSGPQGRFFEVTKSGEIVWQYKNPYSGNAPNPAGDPPYSVFRATFIAAGNPGLGNRNLKPLDPQPPR
ncbi:aryl-sulfate sulfotransferase [candidate division CSSED10-310 bacterium]|uniref:Aryl-sulfate sulfotransferase n=1 Tax=candidate division CSSED10-310 bacterium TaxID=2855610 RepID=A0ABV6YX37_UNCC1